MERGKEEASVWGGVAFFSLSLYLTGCDTGSGQEVWLSLVVFS